MYINMPYDYDRTPVPYVETISTNISSDGTFNSFNDMLEKISLRIKSLNDKEKIFGLYEDCVYFGDDENKKLNEYIKSISIKEKENIFDYYD